MVKLGKILHFKFLGYTYWFISINISQLEKHYISVDQVWYTSSVIAQYVDTSVIKLKLKFHKTALPHDMIFTKEFNCFIDEQAKVLYRN